MKHFYFQDKSTRTAKFKLKLKYYFMVQLVLINKHNC